MHYIRDMCKTISHAVNACSFKKNYVLLKNEHKVQNLHIKEMLSNAYKKIIQNFLVHIKKLLKKLFDRIRTKPSSQSMLRNRHDSSVPNGIL